MQLSALIQRMAELLPHDSKGSRVAQLLSSTAGQIARATTISDVSAVLETQKQPLYRTFRDHTRSRSAAQLLTLKVLNLLLAKHQFLRRHSELIARPFGILVDPSNGCNLACPGCVHSASAASNRLFDWPPGMLSEQRFQEFLRRFGPYAVQVLFCNYGEPLLNPKTPAFIRAAKRYLLHTVLSTNLAMTRVDADAYVASGLDYMVLSIDGATQPVYAKFRRNGAIETVFRNIERLVAAKIRSGKRTPILSWQYLAFEHNVDEIPLALYIARSLGIDVFKIATPFDVSWDQQGIRPARVQPAIIELSTSGTTLAANWNPFPHEIEEESINREFDTAWCDRGSSVQRCEDASSSHTCHWLYKNIVMDAHGRVFPCACAPGPDKDLTFTTFPNSAADPFNSLKHRQSRSFFADRDAGATYCAECTWNQIKTDIDTAQVEDYLRSAGGGIFNEESVDMLSVW